MFPLNCIIIVISCCIFIITIIRSLIFVSCFPAFKDYSLLCSTFSSISSSTLRFHIYLHFVNPSWDLCDDKQPTFFHCDFWFLFLWISCFFPPYMHLSAACPPIFLQPALSYFVFTFEWKFSKHRTTIFQNQSSSLASLRSIHTPWISLGYAGCIFKYVAVGFTPLLHLLPCTWCRWFTL